MVDHHGRHAGSASWRHGSGKRFRHQCRLRKHLDYDLPVAGGSDRQAGGSVSVTLQFCGFESLIARVIEKFTDPLGKTGHVDLVLMDGSLLGAQNESGLGGKPSGVQIRPASYVAESGGTDLIRVTIPTDPFADKKVYDFAMAQIGKPYDVTAIAGFVAGRNWREDDAWFCSELAAAALEQGAIFPSPLYAPANKITPAGLLLVASAFGRAEALAEK